MNIHKRRCARRGENDIRAWIEIWNQDPKPFAWTKTAEEIPHSLAEYLTKISPAAHEESRELRSSGREAMPAVPGEAAPHRE